MLVAVPAGKSRIDVRFVRTVDRTIGGILSILSSLAAGALLIWLPRARQP
jgi:hypothetical protein